jgi:KRAB domain-containing zinc finger protein
LNRKFPCDLCDKIFNSWPSLFYHKKVVHLKTGHKCGHCSKIFTSVINLALHIKSKHLDRRYTCDICSKVYKSHFLITRHMKNEHLNAIKYHTCKICNKRYASLSALWHHSFQHRGFKPFKCTACDYTNVCKLSFKQHLRKRHQIIYNEQIHGYKKETFSEALKYVLLENKK